MPQLWKGIESNKKIRLLAWAEHWLMLTDTVDSTELAKISHPEY